MFFSARPFHFFCGASSLLFPLLRPAFFFLRGFFPAFPSSSPRFLLPPGLFTSFSSPSPRFLLPPGLFSCFSFFFAPLSSFCGAFPLLPPSLRPARHNTFHFFARPHFPSPSLRFLSARLPHSRTYEQKERLPRMHNTLCTSKKPLLLFYHCLIGLPPTPLSHC